MLRAMMIHLFIKFISIMQVLTEVCAKILKCKVKELRDRLNHPADRECILKELEGKKVRTTYQDRNGFTKTFFLGGISLKGAVDIPAFGRLRRPFNISVCAYFYARHKLRLHHPYLHCVIENSCLNGEPRYYPMELVTLVTEPEGSESLHLNSTLTPKIINFGQLFREINLDNGKESSWKSMHSYEEEIHASHEVDEDEQSYKLGRASCSQYY